MCVYFVMQACVGRPAVGQSLPVFSENPLHFSGLTLSPEGVLHGWFTSRRGEVRFLLKSSMSRLTAPTWRIPWRPGVR